MSAHAQNQIAINHTDFVITTPKIPRRMLNSSYFPDINDKLPLRTLTTSEPKTTTSFVGKKYILSKTFHKHADSDSKGKGRDAKEAITGDLQLSTIIVEERKVKHDINKNKLIPKIPKLDIKIVETWINTTLKDIEPYALPKSRIIDDSKPPLVKFGIDREKLLVSLNIYT